MLPRARRVPRSLFPDIIKKGAGFHATAASLRAYKLPHPGPSLLAVVVAAKQVKKAAARNKVKRRARHVLRQQLAKLKDGYALVFFFRGGAAALSFNELQQEMTHLLQQAKLIN